METKPSLMNLSEETEKWSGVFSVCKRIKNFSQDIIQGVAERYVRAVKKGEEIRNPEAWASTVASHLSVDSYRENSRLEFSDDLVSIATDESPSYIEHDIDKRSSYRLMMAVLPRNEEGQQLRQVLRLAAEGLVIKEITKSLKVSKPVVTEKLEQLAQLMEIIEKACERGSGILSERQRLILLHIKREKAGKDIARLLHISEALVSKELEAVRKILSECPNGPWDDGGGGQSRYLRNRSTTSQVCRHGPSIARSTSVKSLLCLPAFQERRTMNTINIFTLFSLMGGTGSGSPVCIWAVRLRSMTGDKGRYQRLTRLGPEHAMGSATFRHVSKLSDLDKDRYRRLEKARVRSTIGDIGRSDILASPPAAECRGSGLAIGSAVLRLRYPDGDVLPHGRSDILASPPAAECRGSGLAIGSAVLRLRYPDGDVLPHGRSDILASPPAAECRGIRKGGLSQRSGKTELRFRRVSCLIS